MNPNERTEQTKVAEVGCAKEKTQWGPQGFWPGQWETRSCSFPSWDRLGMAGVGRYAEGNEELGFRHASLEMPKRHPSGDEVEIEQRVVR